MENIVLLQAVFLIVDEEAKEISSRSFIILKGSASNSYVFSSEDFFKKQQSNYAVDTKPNAAPMNANAPSFVSGATTGSSPVDGTTVTHLSSGVTSGVGNEHSGRQAPQHFGGDSVFESAVPMMNANAASFEPPAASNFDGDNAFAAAMDYPVGTISEDGSGYYFFDGQNWQPYGNGGGTYAWDEYDETENEEDWNQDELDEIIYDDFEDGGMEGTGVQGGGLMPLGATPSQGGVLSPYASEFWFPECRDCACCKGFKHGTVISSSSDVF